MLVAFVDEPLIHLVAEAQGVMFDAKVCDGLELISGENLPGGGGALSVKYVSG